MDAVRITALREVLSGTGWIEATRDFAGSLRRSVTRPAAAPGGLLLVGTEREEPWHLAAHLADEAAWCGVPELSPVLLRHTVREGAPAHLSVPVRRLERARRGETVFVVAAGAAPGEGLLERVAGARRQGATVLALSAAEGSELLGVAHEALTAPEHEVPFDIVQHLVSAAAGEEAPRGGWRRRLGKAVEGMVRPTAMRW